MIFLKGVEEGEGGESGEEKSEWEDFFLRIKKELLKDKR